MWKKIILSVALLGSIAFFGLNTEAQAGHCHGGYGGGYYGGGYSGGYYGGYNRGFGGCNSGYYSNSGYSPYYYGGGYRGGYYPNRGNSFYYGSRGFGIGIYTR